MSKPTVCLIYGFGEGEWNGRPFRAALRRRGFPVVEHPDKANIVIAHSAGCFYLPDTGKEQFTVLIGPPYWPGRSIVLNFMIKGVRDFGYYAHHHMLPAWFIKTFHNSRYILGGLRKAIAIAQHANRHDFYLALQQKRVLILRNEHDAFLTPQAPDLLAQHAHFSFHALPGEHDDCWVNPDRYIDIIEQHLI